MPKLLHHNPRLEAQMAQHFQGARWAELADWLGALSHTDFRTAGALLAERFLPLCREDDFWTAFVTIVPRNPKAYLGTFLKAAVVLVRDKGHSVTHPTLTSYARSVSAAERHVDVRKSLEALLPVVSAPKDISHLFESFGVADKKEQLSYLHKSRTPAAYFLVFGLLKEQEHDKNFIGRYAKALVKQGDRMAYNFASLLQQYFSLADIGATFSLHIAPYQLNYADQSYDTFKKLLESI